MITHLLIAFEDFLGSSIAWQVMPPWIALVGTPENQMFHDNDCHKDDLKYHLEYSMLMSNDGLGNQGGVSQVMTGEWCEWWLVIAENQSVKPLFYDIWMNYLVSLFLFFWA